jgi:hypothetical protein
MLLVEPDFIEKLKQNDNTPLNSLSRLDGEMQKILRSKIEDREKWALYSQALQRFLHFTETDRKPFKLPIIVDGVSDVHEDFEKSMVKKEETEYNATLPNPKPTEGDATSTPPNHNYPLQFTPSHIIKVIPKSYVKKGQSLLDNILQNKQKIWWKEGGEIVVNNQVIPESNIIDLISDTVRPLKRAKPIGWKQFASVLKDIGVPTSCIGNPSNLEYINGLQIVEDQETPIYKNTRSTSIQARGQSTPISNKSLESSKKKIDWQRWSPY